MLFQDENPHKLSNMPQAMYAKVETWEMDIADKSSTSHVNNQYHFDW